MAGTGDPGITAWNQLLIDQATQLADAAVDVGTNPDAFAQRTVHNNLAHNQLLAAIMTDMHNLKQLCAGSGSTLGANRKQLGESRCVSNMKTLGSDKSEFKNWNEKFINALAQVLGPQWRVFMKSLNKELDTNRKIIPESDLHRINGSQHLGDVAKANEDLFYVLVEKTEGEAALRVNSTEPGEGIMAYQKIYLWFAGTTGLALSERTRMLMHPEAPKREEDIAEAIEKWCEQERLLLAHGDDYKLSAAFKITALRVLMSCKREQFELMEREARTQHRDVINDDMFADLLNKAREYAAKRRLEAHFRKQKGDPMDIGQVGDHGSNWMDGPEKWYQDTMWTQEATEATWQGESVDALAKGKAKSKGVPKGKGKDVKGKGKTSPATKGAMGKGPMFGSCWTCGGPHFQSECPEKGCNTGSKGKGQAASKGKGKGANEVQYEEEYWQSEQLNANVEMGGGTIDEVEPTWAMVAKRARAKPNRFTFRHRGNVVDFVGRDQEATINEIGDFQGRWERIPLKIDSGAIDTVIPPHVATYFPVRETEASRSGAGFRAANGTHIANHGQRNITALGDEWNTMKIKAQVADVRTPLGSVYQILRAGNIVHFEKGNCYMQNNTTGSKTPIHEKGGTFEIGLWIPAPGSKQQAATGTTNTCSNSTHGMDNTRRINTANMNHNCGINTGEQQRQRSTESNARGINGLRLHNRFAALCEDEDAGIKMEGFAGQVGEF